VARLRFSAWVHTAACINGIQMCGGYDWATGAQRPQCAEDAARGLLLGQTGKSLTSK